jgi:hypothetical protein
MNSAFERIERSLKQAIAFAKGKKVKARVYLLKDGKDSKSATTSHGTKA